jgi:hypothetical protein
LVWSNWIEYAYHRWAMHWPSLYQPAAMGHTLHHAAPSDPQHIRRRNGRDSNCEKPFPLTSLRASYSAIVMPSTAVTSAGRQATWGSRKSFPPRDPLGSGRILSASLVRFGASAWPMSEGCIIATNDGPAETLSSLI